MVKADPAHTGHIPFPSFASWADAGGSGGMTEEELNHAEVLGNVAQRCFDALHEGRCLVEVLGTIDSMTVQGMVGKYSESLKAGNATGLFQSISSFDKCFGSRTSLAVSNPSILGGSEPRLGKREDRGEGS